MKDKIGIAQFREWKAFYSVRPFGPEWEDYRSAYNTWHTSFGPKRLSECMPEIMGREKKQQSAADQAAVLNSMMEK